MPFGVEGIRRNLSRGIKERKEGKELEKTRNDLEELIGEDVELEIDVKDHTLPKQIIHGMLSNVYGNSVEVVYGKGKHPVNLEIIKKYRKLNYE